MIEMYASTYVIGLLTGVTWWIACSSIGLVAVGVFALIGVGAYLARRGVYRGHTWARR